MALMEFAHAPLGINLLDGLYAALVAFVSIGVLFAVLRILPRPRSIRGRWLYAKLSLATVAGILALVFGALYTGLLTT
jgi:hypothetical protein